MTGGGVRKFQEKVWNDMRAEQIRSRFAYLHLT